MKMLSLKYSKYGAYIYYIYRFFRNVRLLFSYPNNYPTRSKQLVGFVCNLIANYKTNLLICTCRPYDSIYCGIQIKKILCSKIIVKSYYLDNLFEPESSNSLIKHIQRRRMIKAFKRECNILDNIFIPINADKCLDFTDKVQRLGFPSYTIPDNYKHCDFCFSSHTVNLLYIGTINYHNRNIEFILNMIDHINRGNIKKKYFLHLWGKVQDSESLILINSSDYVIHHGYIDNLYTVDLIKKCDCVINISNKMTPNFLPSKIFQLFALGVKVANIVFCENDCSTTFFKHYNNSLSLNFKMNLHDASCQLQEFIDSPVINVAYEDPIFQKFEPKYICDILEQI